METVVARSQASSFAASLSSPPPATIIARATSSCRLSVWPRAAGKIGNPKKGGAETHAANAFGTTAMNQLFCHFARFTLLNRLTNPPPNGVCVMKRIASRTVFSPALGLLMLVSAFAYAGSLTPPGAPGPTMKPLSEIEPRIPIKQSDLPLNITQSGSYYLTESVTYTPPPNPAALVKDAILISADNVSIDLNGFSLSGPGKDQENGIGINAFGLYKNLTVKNGTVQGFPEFGIRLWEYATVMDVQANSNGRVGIFVYNNSTIRKCTASFNGPAAFQDTYAIIANGGSIVQDSVCSYNVASSGYSCYGIYCMSHCSITNNICLNNVGDVKTSGIECVNSCAVRGNTVCSNSANKSCVGILTDMNCTIEENICNSNFINGSQVNSTAYGIQVGGRCNILANTCNNNSGYFDGAGIFSNEECSFGKNVCMYNYGTNKAYGIYTGAGSSLTDNTCNNNYSVSESGEAVGISGGNRCSLRNNTCNNNKASIGLGIRTGEKSSVSGNACSENESTGVYAAGIYSTSGIFDGNSCSGNFSTHTDGIGYGIRVNGKGVLSNNSCNDNHGKGMGGGVGIFVSGDYSRIENNCCTGQYGELANNAGIVINGNKVVVTSNTCSNNPGRDIHFRSGTSNGYAGGNLTDLGIVDEGSNNETGTTPAPNAQF
jgi:hypothetical protein